MCLKHSDISSWGSVEGFFASIQTTKARGRYIDIKSQVWGKLPKYGLQPKPGDGIAFYHTKNAKFERPDPYGRRPRISLIGEIRDIEQAGLDIRMIDVKVRTEDLERMRHQPIVRDETNAYLFQECGIGPGLVGTFYFAPVETWNSFLCIAGIRKGSIGSSPFSLPEEVAGGKRYIEGAVERIFVNRYERDPNARSACIRAHGAKCSVCDFEFGKVYGQIGDGFIHVHHLNPISKLKQAAQINPIKDLRPVCPNCHAMLHAQGSIRTIAFLKKQVQKNRGMP